MLKLVHNLTASVSRVFENRKTKSILLHKKRSYPIIIDNYKDKIICVCSGGEVYWLKESGRGLKLLMDVRDPVSFFRTDYIRNVFVFIVDDGERGCFVAIYSVKNCVLLLRKNIGEIDEAIISINSGVIYWKLGSDLHSFSYVLNESNSLTINDLHLLCLDSNSNEIILFEKSRLNATIYQVQNNQVVKSCFLDIGEPADGFVDEKLFIVASKLGWVVCFDRQNSSVIWKRENLSRRLYSNASVIPNHIGVVEWNNILLLNKVNGEVEKSYCELGFSPRKFLVLGSGSIVLTDGSEPYLYVVSEGSSSLKVKEVVF